MRDESEVRICLEWGRQDQFYTDRSQRLIFYGVVDDGTFSSHRVVNLLDDGPYKGLDNFQWWCAQPRDSPYMSERIDLYSQLNITSSNIDKIDKIAELTFTMPISKGYFKIPKD